jgi:hypothetical protein
MFKRPWSEEAERAGETAQKHDFKNEDGRNRPYSRTYEHRSGERIVLFNTEGHIWYHLRSTVDKGIMFGTGPDRSQTIASGKNAVQLDRHLNDRAKAQRPSA